MPILKSLFSNEGAFFMGKISNKIVGDAEFKTLTIARFVRFFFMVQNVVFSLPLFRRGGGGLRVRML